MPIKLAGTVGAIDGVVVIVGGAGLLAGRFDAVGVGAAVVGTVDGVVVIAVDGESDGCGEGSPVQDVGPTNSATTAMSSTFVLRWESTVCLPSDHGKRRSTRTQRHPLLQPVTDDEYTDAPHHRRLPSHPDDYDWDMCSEVFFEDHDILLLYDGQFDGVEDPETELNEQFRIGDLRPANWFTPFRSQPPRKAGN